MKTKEQIQKEINKIDIKRQILVLQLNDIDLYDDIANILQRSMPFDRKTIQDLKRIGELLMGNRKIREKLKESL